MGLHGFLLIVSLFGVIAVAQPTEGTLLATLASIPELSNLTTFFQPYQEALAGRSNITFLAPNNDAFTLFLNSSVGASLGSDAALISAILEYHILNGTRSNFTNTSFVPSSLGVGAYANVTGGQHVEAVGGSYTTFISGLLQNTTVVNSTNFTGGIIHIIDQFLTLPQNATFTGAALNLSTAVGAFTNLSLADTLDVTRDVTLLVPYNGAFQSVGGNLANMSTEELTSILEYHAIVVSVLYTTDLMNDTTVSTLQGGNITVVLEGSDVYLNNAKVVFPNILTSNGVIHVLDQVLNPANSLAGPGKSSFGTDISSDDTPFTSRVATPTSSIALAPTKPASTTTASDTNGSGSKSTSSSHTGAIAGGVVGGVLFVALLLLLFWFIRRKRSRNNSRGRNAANSISNNDTAAAAIGRKETTKSYHKPELEATTRTYQKPELEADSTPYTERQPNAPVDRQVNEVDTPMSRIRTELSGTTAPQGTTGTPASPTQPEPAVSNQAEQQRIREQEAEDARFAEIAHQRRQAELEYQKKMAELEHEQRMAELDITAARLRNRNRTLSELEAVANPGPGSAD